MTQLGQAVIFVTNKSYVSTSGGGVQWCTRDYTNAIAAAGYSVESISYQNDQSLVSKVCRRIVPRPFEYLVPKQVTHSIERSVRRHSASVVFLNNSEPLILASELRKRFASSVKLIFCSHGAESTDLHNTQLFERKSLRRVARTSKWMGRVIDAEAKQRQCLDGTICISEDDVIFERWLGSPRILFLPRPVQINSLRRNPIANRFGTVSTLNHVPNLDGIRRLASKLDDSPGLQFRVVGGPPDIGRQLEANHRCVQYVGRLNDEELAEEAGTWKCFANPIFCQGRGASTKVAAALGWGLPVASTRVGVRGYRWDDSIMPLSEHCGDLATLITKYLSDEISDEEWSNRCRQISAMAPTAVHSGHLLRSFVDSLDS